jgi:hypothetical protein
MILLEVFLFHGSTHLSLGAHPLGEIGVFPFSIHMVLEVSSLGLALRTLFLEGPFSLLGYFLVVGLVMILPVLPSLRELTLQPFLDLPTKPI